MRIAYLIAGIIVAASVICNGPRLPWIDTVDGGPIGILRGFAHGVIGFSWLATWLLLAAGVYQLILGLIYWDMETAEAHRWQFTLETGMTAKLLWITGGVCLLAGIGYAIYVFSHDAMLWPCGVMSSVVSLVACWLFWLAFPVMEQVGIDREEFGI